MALDSFPLTVKTYIPKGEFALEDYQWLCSASRYEEREGKELVKSTKNQKMTGGDGTWKASLQPCLS